MADRPILFSGPMVRAIIEGRKTQTRRIIEPHEPAPLVAGGEKPAGNLVTLKIPARHGGWMQGPTFKLKYAPGDRLWVREAWTDIDAQPHCDLAYAGMTGFAYRATDDDEMTIPPRWRPGIHMRRVDSRLTLLVTAVRVERLQDISEANAIAEGCKGQNCPPDHNDDLSPVEEFRDLWESLNAARAPWLANPWVVAVTFEAHQRNIDQMPAPEQGGDDHG